MLFGLRLMKGAINIHRALCRETWEVDENLLVEIASAGLEKELMPYLRELPPAHSWQVARGHDLIHVLRIGLQHVLGDMPASVGTNDIARSLRLAMDTNELSTTELWRDIRLWEKTNSPYQVLFV